MEATNAQCSVTGALPSCPSFPEFTACHLSDCLSLLKLTTMDSLCWRPVQKPWVQLATQSHHGTLCLSVSQWLTGCWDKEVLKGMSWKEEMLLLLLVFKIPAGLRNGHSFFFCRKLITRKSVHVQAFALSEAWLKGNSGTRSSPVSMSRVSKSSDGFVFRVPSHRCLD